MLIVLGAVWVSKHSWIIYNKQLWDVNHVRKLGFSVSLLRTQPKLFYTQTLRENLSFQDSLKYDVDLCSASAVCLISLFSGFLLSEDKVIKASLLQRMKHQSRESPIVTGALSL